MRNEEMEQHLQKSQSQCWTLKQIILDQQNLITALRNERQHYTDELFDNWDRQRLTLNFAEFEIDRLSELVRGSGTLKDILKMASECLQKVTIADAKCDNAEKAAQEAIDESGVVRQENESLRERAAALEGETEYLQGLLSSQKL